MSDIELCEKCKGSGNVVVIKPSYRREKAVKTQEVCESCGGVGYIELNTFK